MSHWIVKVKTSHGSQWAHVEDDDQATTILADPRFDGLVSDWFGPCETAEEAWLQWHKNQGSI